MLQKSSAAEQLRPLFNLVLLLPVLLVLAAGWLLGDDSGAFFIWWLTLSGLGLTVWPLLSRFMPGATRGFLPAKALGLALLALLSWQCGYLHLLPLRQWSLLLLALPLAASWLWRPGRELILTDWRSPAFRLSLISAESFFAALLLIWTFARGLKPELDSLEKFMDVAYMSSIWRGSSLPAQDPWLAGHSINYYYFGQYVYAMLARLTAIRVPVAYNLGMATTFAMTGSLSFAVGGLLPVLARRLGLALKRGAELAGGLVTAFLVTLAGNSHAFFYHPDAPGYHILQAMQKAGWPTGDLTVPFWFADSTRFIGYNPDTTDKTIHEFPFYSFLVADLHAHLINLTFVLLLLCILAAYLATVRPAGAGLSAIAKTARQIAGPGQAPIPPAYNRHVTSAHAYNRQATPAGAAAWPASGIQALWAEAATLLRQTLLDRPLALIGMLLAIFMMGNYWDFAIYLAVSTAVLFVSALRQTGWCSWRGLIMLIGQMILLLLVYLKVAQPLVALAAWLAVLILNHLLAARFMPPDALVWTGLRLSWLFVLAHAIALPFNLSFEPMAKSIRATASRTPLFQLLILWGPHILAGLLFMAFLIWQFWRLNRQRPISHPGQNGEQNPDRESRDPLLQPGGMQSLPVRHVAGQAGLSGDDQTNPVVRPVVRRPLADDSARWMQAGSPHHPWYEHLLRQNPLDILVAVLYLAALGLLIVPELVYVVDIYSGDYKRANTMFKFTYQAFVLLGIVWGYALVRLTAVSAETGNKTVAEPRGAGIFRISLACVLGLLLLIPAWYPWPAASQWLGPLGRANYRGLDGLAVLADKDSSDIPGAMAGELADDLAAIAWLNQHVQGQPVILEADGPSYTDYCRISVFTGLPTVFGWETHEWLWRTSSRQADAYGKLVLPRQDDIRELYTGTDQVVRQALLDRYQIRYIVIGSLEMAKYGENGPDDNWQSSVQAELLQEFGTVVFAAPTLQIIEVTAG